MSVTSNGSAQVGSAVICHRCQESRDYDATNRKWCGLNGPHCTTCHSDHHRACAVCGSCLPNNHRWDRWYCSNTCRVYAKRERDQAQLEREIWEAEHPEDAAKQRAEDEARWRELRVALEAIDGPGRGDHLKRQAELKDRAERCAKCDKPFEDRDTIYRRAERSFFGPVLPYCGEHRCPQPAGRHNADLEDGYYYPGCRCPNGRGDRQWLEPKPCAFCGRLVANDRKTANPHKFVREWHYFGEAGEPRVRTFCSENCRRSVARVEAKAKRLSERGDRGCRCESCGETFAAGRSDSRYCSAACRQRAYRTRRNAERIEAER